MTNDQQNQILDQVGQIISDLFGVEPKDISLETPREEVPGWDSLQHVNLILDVEQQFSIHFDETQVASIRTVGDLVRAIESMGSN